MTDISRNHVRNLARELREQRNHVVTLHDLADILERLREIAKPADGHSVEKK